MTRSPRVSEAFDRQRQVNLAARLVARHLTLRHSVEALIATLARALLREDAGFHAYQALEASVRQFDEWGNTDEAHILIAVARYLAAHSPTERSELQTADIAGGSCVVVSFIRIPQHEVAGHRSRPAQTMFKRDHAQQHCGVRREEARR
jgi:hypothetical protein